MSPRPHYLLLFERVVFAPRLEWMPLPQTVLVIWYPFSSGCPAAKFRYFFFAYYLVLFWDDFLLLSDVETRNYSGYLEFLDLLSSPAVPCPITPGWGPRSRPFVFRPKFCVPFLYLFTSPIFIRFSSRSRSNFRFCSCNSVFSFFSLGSVPSSILSWRAFNSSFAFICPTSSNFLKKLSAIFHVNFLRPPQMTVRSNARNY